MKTTRLLSAALLCLGAACKGPAPEPASVTLTVTFPRSLELDRVAIAATLPTDPPRSVETTVPNPPRRLNPDDETVVLVLPPDVGEGAMPVEVRGYLGAEMRAVASLQLTVGAASMSAQVSLQPAESCEGEACADPCEGPDGCCGDSAVQAGEGCDDGGEAPNDGCAADCTVEPGYLCTGAPSVCEIDCRDGACERCGDGVLDAPETCDDGDRTSGDGCNAACQVEVGWSCEGAPSSCAPVCGDGRVFGAEACDDGDRDPGDGCNADCAVEVGFACNGAPSSCAGICGDGLLRGDETCDDENRRPNDGCDRDCAVSPGYTCRGEPSVCTEDVEADAGVEIDGGEVEDAGTADAGFSDSGASDAGPADGGVEDAGMAEDAGGADSGAAADSGAVADAGTADSGAPADAGSPDSGVADAGSPDSGVPPDAGFPDSGVAPDAGFPDSGVPPDAGPTWSAAALVFVNPPGQLTSGACTALTVRRVDAQGQPAPDNLSLTLDLWASAASNTSFHDNAACGGNLTSVGLPAGQTDRLVYARARRAGSTFLRASTSGLLDATWSGQVVAGPPATLRLVGVPSSGVFGTCPTAQSSVQLFDAVGNPARAPSDVSVRFSSSPAGGAWVYPTAGCVDADVRVTIPSGSTSQGFWIAGSRAGSFSVIASSPGLVATAAPLSVTDAAGSCTGCGPGAGCVNDCAGVSCNQDCPRGCACQLGCTSVLNTRCAPDCEQGSQCHIGCQGSGDCRANCKDESDCVIDCDGAAFCDRPKCEDDAQCLIVCGNASPCEFDKCETGGQTSCPGGVVVCNRPCP